MTFRRCLFRPTTKRGFNPHRLAAARRWLDREAASLPLFRAQIRASQPTPEERVQAADESFAAWRRQVRTLTARQWREARRLLHELPPLERAALIAAWNASPYPKDSAYCLEFIRQRAGTEESHPTASHPDPPTLERPMITGIPYLTLRDPRDPTRTFTYYAHPDGESVNIGFQDTEGTATFGPWHLDAAERHAAHLRQAGYLVTQERRTPPALEPRAEVFPQKRGLVATAGPDSLPDAE